MAPVDQRPEFVAQGKVDDSRTRVFGRLTQDVTAEKAPEQQPEADEDADFKLATPARQRLEKPEPEEKQEKAEGGTIRLSRAQIDELQQSLEAADPERPKGKKRSEIKPMKKKKSLFGRRKAEEDDFAEDADDSFDDSDDDFFE